MIMEEDYCSEELSKLLQEKGFNEPCTGIDKLLCKEGEKPVLRITHQKAMKWLRDKWLLHVEVYVRPFEKGRERTDKWFYDFCIKNPRTFTVEGQGETYLTYEEAVEAALKYCLENLI